jgi:hypothetical protein
MMHGQQNVKFISHSFIVIAAYSKFISFIGGSSDACVHVCVCVCARARARASCNLLYFMISETELK